MTDFDADAIPPVLRENDRWLMWDASADTPRRPHWRGDFSVSWSDPDDWHTFEEAVEAATERESWGIGYVFTPDHDLYAVDIDTPYTDDGEPREWFPGLGTFDGETYIERSPSGNGLHILSEGEPPEWWRDSEVDPDGHQGVEALTNKFCTVTGDTTDESASAIEPVDASSWFTEAYHRIRGELPSVDRPDHSDSDPDDDLSREQVEDALSNVDPDLPHSEWIRIGYAVRDWDGGSTGRSVFESWSKRGTKWDSAAERSVESIWQNATSGQVTVGTLVHYATEGGWEPPWSGAIATEPGDESQITDPSTVDPSPYLQAHNGAWGYWGDDEEWNTVLNCQLEVNRRVELADDNVLEITVHPRTGDSYDVTVEPTAFHDKRRFRDKVLAGRTATFSGKETSLNNVKKAVGTQPAPAVEGTHQMGLHGDEFVTPNGVLTADGWADDPATILVERGIGAERKWTLEPDVGDDGEAVREIVTLLPRTRDPERLIPVLGWVVAATVRPVIMDLTGQFNLLAVLGETGSGKTSTLSAVWRAFGMDGDPFSATDTTFALTTTLASTNAIPMWYDEYKPSDMADRQVDTFHELLRKSTRGGVEQRGQRDGSTEEYKLYAPVMVSGEERIHGSAEERRAVFTTFKPASTEPGTDTARAFAQLTGGSYVDGETVEHFDGFDLRRHALAFYRFILAHDGIEDLWREQQRRVSELLASEGMDPPGDLVFQGLQTVAFGAELYREFAAEYDADVMDAGEIDDAVGYLADHVTASGGRRSHWDVFLDVATRAAANGELEDGEHYTVVNDGGPDAELRIHLPTAFDLVNRYAREHDVAEDLLGSGADYRERARDMAGESYITDHSVRTHLRGGQQRCVGIDLTQANDRVQAFEPSTWGADASEPSGEERVHRIIDHNTGDGAVSISTAKGIATGSAGMDPDAFDHALQKLKDRGDVMERVAGKVELV